MPLPNDLCDMPRFMSEETHGVHMHNLQHKHRCVYQVVVSNVVMCSVTSVF